MKEMKVSILGFGMMGTVRAVAYEAVTRYYKDSPIKPVLYQAFTLPTEADSAKASGWDASTDLAATIANPEAEYVDVCLPNAMHRDAALAAFEAGKHVFCEKPLSASLAEGREMAAAADAHSSQLGSVNFIYRRAPANVYARKIVAEKRFGKLLEARMYYNQSWGGPDTPYSWRFDAAAGGGAAGDLGSHAIDMLYYTTGMRPIDICALKATHVKERSVPGAVGSDFEARYNKSGAAQNAVKKSVEVDDAMKILFTLPEGAVGTLGVTRNAWGTENTHGYELYFENGAIRWCYDELNYLWVYDATQPAETQGWTHVCCNRPQFAYNSFASGHMYGYRDLMVNACYENMRALAGVQSESPIATFRDAFNVQRTLEACAQSIKNRCWVKLDDVQ